MAVQARDKGHPEPGRVSRGMCVSKKNDENGKPCLVIDAPDPNSRDVNEVVKEIFTQTPKELSTDFKRSATLVRLMIFLLTATSDTEQLPKKMSEIGTKFNGLYMKLRGELQGLMVRSSDMFELFKTACYYFDEGNVDFGKERLEEMRRKSTDGRKICDDILQLRKQVEGDVGELIATLTERRGEIGQEAFKMYSACLSQCLSGVKKIASFLSEQSTFLTEMQHTFDLEERCANMQRDLNKRTFQQLTDNDTPGGFMYEIHGTIVRCIAAKKMSKEYTDHLNAERAVFTQMISSTPSKTMAQQSVPKMMEDYNEKYPDFKLDYTPAMKTSSTWFDGWCVMM